MLKSWLPSSIGDSSRTERVGTRQVSKQCSSLHILRRVSRKRALPTETSMKRAFTQYGIKSFFLVTVVFILTQTYLATTAVRPSDDALNIGARAIVRGKVISLESAVDETTNRIYTYITVKVQEVIKGQITERRIVLKEMGGQAGDRI